MTERQRGKVGLVLDNDILLEATLKQIASAQDRAWATLAFDLNVLYVTERGLAIVTSEGVGHIEEGGTIKVEVALGGFLVSVKVPVEDARRAATTTGADLADVVRSFGARLENNFWIWHAQIIDRPTMGQERES